MEFDHPEHVLYEFPEEFRPEVDTGPDKARYDATLSDLVSEGLLHDGQRLVMSWRPRTAEKQIHFEGRITAGGEIETLGKKFASPSYAAVCAMQSAGSDRSTENGWHRWKTEDGVLLSTLREQYLASRDG